ncbi:MAG: HEAT repeat domain-containing protein, partial [Nitrospiria bacterium]
TKDEILYQGAPIAKDNPVIRELANLLHQLNLIGVTFCKGLTEDDILRYIKMIADDRSPLLSEREQAIFRFQEEVHSILLQFISFEGAVQGQEDGFFSAQDGGSGAGNTRGDIWKNLVDQLTGERRPGEVGGTDGPESDAAFDPVQAANVINHLYQEKKGENVKKEYEGVIVDYLHQHASRTIAGKEQSFQMRQEMGKLFSNLRPDVREQIFRFSLEKNEGDHLAMEGLLDTLPPAVLPEVLNQIQMSDQTVSTPMFSLMKKLVNLSASDRSFQNQLESKVQEHKALFHDLFIDRSDRLFYPSQYRSLLDDELISDPGSQTTPLESETISLDEAETNYHLALILLDLLEGPIFSEGQYGGCVDYMNWLLTEGLGENTQMILMEAIWILLKRHTSEYDAHHIFFQGQIKKFLTPEIITTLLQTRDETEREEEDHLLGRIIGIMGAELIPILLDILEVEDHLVVRKRILHLIVGCGKEAVPFVLKCLNSEKWYVVRNMLVLLRDLRADDVIPQVANFMNHDSAQVRLAALQTIGTIGTDTDTLYQALAGSLADSDPKVFKTAVFSLVTMDHPDAVKMIMGQLEGTDKEGHSRERQLHIIKTIGDVGTEAWITHLSPLRKGTSWRFWRWDRQRALQEEVEEAVSKINSRTKSDLHKPGAPCQTPRSQHTESKRPRAPNNS